MATGARIPMPIEAQVLTLSQWLSPAYPVGAFAYSHGLEGAVAQGWVADATGLEVWLADVLRFGAGRADALFLAAAYGAADDAAVRSVDAMARAFAASKERMAEAERMGEAFCAVTAAVWGARLDGLVFPVALGRAAKLEGLPKGLTAKMYLQSFASNLVAAGQRLLSVGQTEGQAMLRRLTRVCAEIAEETRDGDLDGLSASAFMGDIASMKHETQYSRIFRT